MQFQKVLKEINSQNPRKRLDEALLTDIIDNWPFLIVNQYKFDNATDPKEKAGYENTLNKNIIPINTTINNRDKWTGDLAKDFIELIKNRPYQSSTYTINNNKKEINIKYGMNNVWISYLTSPTAAALIRRVNNQLQAQKSGELSQQPATNQKPVANPQAPSAMPTAADKVLNKLSTI